MNGEDKLKAAREMFDKGEFSEAAQAYKAILYSGTTTPEVRLGLAKSLCGAADYEKAAKAYQAILNWGTTTEEVRLGLAKSLCGAAEYEKATKAYQAILDSGTTTTEVRLGLAKSLYGMEKDEEAANAYQVIPDSEKTTEVRLDLAKFLCGAGKYDKAAKVYQTILDSGTTTTEVRLGLTKSLYGAEKYHDAANAYQAIPDSNKTLEVRLELVKFLYGAEKDEAAAKAYHAIPESDKTPEVCLDLAEFLYGAGKYDKAAEAYQTILDSGTPTTEVRLGLAKSLCGAAKYDESVKAYRAIPEADISAEIWQALGYSLYCLWSYDEAIAAYRNAIAKDPNAATYDDLGESLYQLRRFREAIANYQEAAKRALANKATAEADAASSSVPEKKEEAAQKRQEAMVEYADRCIDLAYCFLGLKDYDEALEQLKRATDNAKQYPLAYHARASVFCLQGNYEDAMTEWRKAKECYQNCEDEIQQKGWVGYLIYYGTLLHEVFGDLDEAESVYNRALKIFPIYAKARIGLAALYVERQENDPKQRNKAAIEAQGAYQKAREIIKSKKYSDVESLLMIGEMELLMADYDSARTSLTMALQKDEEQKEDDHYMRTAKPNTDLGILCMRTNQCREAIRHFEKAMKIDITDLALRSNLAEAYLRDERLDDAQREFLRVLKTAPDHIESRIGLGAVYSALGDGGDTDMYDAAVTQYSTALLLAKRKAGSKRLKDAELAKVRYSRGYAYVKAFEAAASPKDRRRLYDARVDFRECLRLDGEQHKAQRAIEKIDKVLPRRSPQRIMEDWIPSLIFVLSLGLFLAFQLILLGSLVDKLNLPSYLNFLAQTKPLPSSEYLTVTLGSFLFMVASCYLPQLLKLKVPGIELEKTAVDQITTLGPVGISKPT